jgi:FtsH-binding integral membrane protein
MITGVLVVCTIFDMAALGLGSRGGQVRAVYRSWWFTGLCAAQLLVMFFIGCLLLTGTPDGH